MAVTDVPVDNGVNVDALLGVRDALADTPEIAQFQWRATCSWVKGTHSRSSVDTFYGFGEEQHIRQRSPTTPIIPWRSRLRTTVLRRWSTCSSPWAAA